MKKFVKRYFAVVIPLYVVIALLLTLLCDVIWYSGLIGYSDKIINTIAATSSIICGVLIAITGFNVADEKWTLRIGAK